MGLKNKLYCKALDKLIKDNQKSKENRTEINPSQNILILFEGTENSNRKAVLDFSNQLKSLGKTVKLLSYIDSKGEMTDFGMAVYNNSSVNIYGFPKKHILNLLDSQQFDIIFNLNTKDKTHLHALAVKAKAKFKVSLPTKYKHNFTMLLSTKEKNDMQLILKELIKCLDKLTF
ncbi:MAG TPA: hypothetical protein ENK91_00580 [Bacteroidetes bacterium]|nr:hypothetical protein [Bacteroidota bacterium]